MMMFLSIWRCTGKPPPIGEIVSVTIVPNKPPFGPGGASRTLRVTEDPAAAAFVRALESCRGPELAKFPPSHRVVARGPDGSEVTLLVRGEFVKVEGVAYGCSENVEKLLVQALGTE
jgi:hypothetical protein